MQILYKSRNIFLSKRTQLIFFICLITIGFSTFIYFYFPAQFEKKAIELASSKAEAITDLTSNSIASAIYFGDTLVINNSLKSTFLSRDIISLIIKDSLNRVIYKYNPTRQSQEVFSLNKDEMKLSEDKKSIFCIKPIYNEGKFIGRILIHYSLEEVQQDVVRSKQSITYIAFVGVFLGLFAALFISRIFTEPLNYLKNIFETISDANTLSRALVSGNNEFSALAVSFNKMVDKLEDAYQELSEINKNLETRVDERTVKLKGEIDDRKSAEGNLMRINQLLSSIINSSPLPIVTINNYGEIISVSPAFRILFGYYESEIISKILPFKTIEDKHYYLDSIDSIFKNKRSLQYQTSILKKNNSASIVQLFLSPVFDQTEQVSSCICIIDDITERITKESALKESEEKYRKLIENSLIGIGIFKDSECIFANNSLIEMWGFSDFNEFKSVSIEQFILNKFQDKYRKLLDHASRLNNEVIELEILRKDTEVRVIETSRTFININNFQFIQITFLDITEKKSAEREIKKLNLELEHRVMERTSKLDSALTELKNENEERKKIEEQLRLSDKILQKVGTLVLVTDANANVIYVSPYVKNILGYEPNDMLGTGWWKITSPNENDRLNEKNYIIESIQGERKLINGTYERKIIAKDGSVKWIQWQDAIGEGNTIIGVGHDVTDKVITAEKLKQASNELGNALEKERELGELKTRFISMISHEYRTPLSVILSSANIIYKLIERNDIAKAKTFLAKIESSVQNMVHLLEDVLIIGRSDSGKLEANFDNNNLENLINSIIDDFKSAQNYSNNIYFYKYGDISSINTDEKLMRQILTNLLSNALKYSPDSTPVIIEVRENVWEININIIDTGIGISSDDQKYLFDTFHRGTNVGTISGTGLGMQIVKRCIDVLGGSISISSEIHKGTTVNIILPKIN